MENNIIVYTQPGCPQCKMIKMLMDKEGIKYECCEDVNVMQSLGILHTPTLSVNGIFLVGTQIRDYIKTGIIPENI